MRSMRPLCAALGVLSASSFAAAEEPPPPAEPPAPEAAPGDTPPGPYYIEPPNAESERPPAAPRYEAPPAYGPPIYEPPIYEPPPPPRVQHVAPRSSLWLGGRVGWLVPFGNALVIGDVVGGYVEQSAVPLRDYVSTGPMFEVDIGARLSYYYNLFALWERAELGSGRGDGGLLGDHGGLSGGDTDYWAIGVRASTNPDSVGFVSEVALGYRRARAKWDDGTALELTDGIFEARIGFGADIRVSRAFSLTPMFTLGVGMFGKAELVDPQGNAIDLLSGYNDVDGHGWYTLQLGGHFDLVGGD